MLLENYIYWPEEQKSANWKVSFTRFYKINPLNDSQKVLNYLNKFQTIQKFQTSSKLCKFSAKFS